MASSPGNGRGVKKWVYFSGRALQVVGLVALPSSLWVGFVGHNESGSILIFLVSIVIFYVGYLLTQVVTKS